MSVDPIFGNLDVGGERRAAERTKIDRKHLVFHRADLRGDLSRPLQFNAMPLSVVEGEGEALTALCLRPCQHGRGIQATRKKDDCFHRKVRPARGQTRESVA